MMTRMRVVNRKMKSTQAMKIVMRMGVGIKMWVVVMKRIGYDDKDGDNEKVDGDENSDEALDNGGNCDGEKYDDDIGEDGYVYEDCGENS
ncbi:hypothetical protein ElyMa_001177600 [Elysia marginata]|uniref:Uncharacterized protein n=1 Tax=Elysia marginata TaxID=1093978 RepID=A0AAV4I4E3_9GAST|nr:hypothetical protein ElyMa_001177600 [Elysia marginata]